MNKQTLKACYDKSLQLINAEEAKALFDVFKFRFRIRTITELASDKYLNIPRSYIYQMLKGERPVGKKVKERMQNLLDTIKS
jgi:hypothetical protein